MSPGIPSNATMEAVPADLRALVEQALAEARDELKARGRVTPLLLVRLPDGDISRAPLPGRMAGLMDNGAAKDKLFGFLRGWVAVHRATAVVILTDSWMGLPTEKQKRMFEEEPEKLRELFGPGGLNLDEAEAQGLCTRVEALVATVQDAETVVIINQFYERDDEARRITFGERTVVKFPQGQFRGRQKMFGVKSEDDIR